MNGGKAIVIVGMTGAGKSSYIKQLLTRVDESRLLVYDVQREYFPDEPLPDLDTFANTVKESTDSVAVFEEATIFYNNRGSNKIMREILVSKRHKNNIIILAFHSIRAIPYYIADLINYVVVFKTNDTRDLVSTRFPFLLEAFDRIQTAPQYSFEIVRL